MSQIHAEAAENEVLFERRGAVGLVTLNRPAALNALTLTMVEALHPQLAAWAADPAVKSIVFTGAGGKAFCAGGDIRALYDLGKAGEADQALHFWRREYELNLVIGTFPKPIVSLIGGIVMGGGFGLSAHGRYRVAGDKYLFAMPEVGIGFFPDVGATCILPRLPEHMGRYLAVTGARIGAADALALGLATHALETKDFPNLIAGLAEGGNPDELLLHHKILHHKTNLGPALLAPRRPLIGKAFAGETIAAIIANLESVGAGGFRSDTGLPSEDDLQFAADTVKLMRTKSPTSMAIALEQMRRGLTLDLAGALRLEFRIVSRIVAGSDFYEGVRALLIEKDLRPVWTPSSIEAISELEIQRYFAPLPDDSELT